MSDVTQKNRLHHNLRVAIVHEWLEHYAGSERVVEQLLIMYPQAELFAIVDFMPDAERVMLKGKAVQTTFIQRLPFARRYFRYYLGLMPIAVEQLDLAGFDLIISSNHAVAKGVITGPDQVHVCYVHSPMRYAWDMQAAYLRQSNMERGVRSLYARWLLHTLRNWDVRSAAGVDVFVANSNYIARRIKKVYRREAKVVYPPVDIKMFENIQHNRQDYVVVSRMVPYKRIDLVVEAFLRMPDRTLHVVGDGPEREKIELLAAHAPNIILHGRLSDAEVENYLCKAKAFVFAAEEDFGITMVEAQACGTPLIVFNRGGARDIVLQADEKEGPTGIFFREQSAEAIVAAVDQFEATFPSIEPQLCRANAQRFSEEAFRQNMFRVVESAMSLQN
ncbi:glycosyltransferase family 4 protein [Acetobacter tropicalis]|uniref:Glycosyltransferase n=1 Tax=Acetobacter tropicalis TaxID=104102 RepID=A0A095B2E3_9PROT|nr:glycosyltransferase [Acetobacter tropicalis]KAA8388589.1 glycosyltransferase family 4 protein [Acetobacter tropicalis]KAA8388696.1 glycosyltransferase family 4 protein [Acetobacter tropicalis]KGB23148.1 Glycosyltransferase [Acetobacter tropicalis]MBC9009413.1 glycosyltransferase [Acetobacter tropicalis]MDO8172285.1 glycosyltransferase [Acetobacter tropicalis]